jgi:hypothetical protein
MRAPRFRFPDEVRSTTRDIASRMLLEGTVPATPEELDEWITRRPEVREPLKAGGYDTAFSAEDLFPLLQVFVGRAEGPSQGTVAARRSFDRRWLVGGLLLLLLVVLIAILLLAGSGAGA